MNRVILIGRLGADPEIRFTANGSAIANIRMATNEYWKDKNGDKMERTEWHKVVAFGKAAELVDGRVGKGDMLMVEGKLQTREWDDISGSKRYTTEIVVDRFEFLSKQTRGADEEERPARTRRVKRSEPADPPPVDDSDIPF